MSARVLLMRLDCRVWFEWVDRGANPADGLSRDGVDDHWTRAQGWELSCASAPLWDDLVQLVCSSVEASTNKRTFIRCMNVGKGMGG